MTTTYHRLETQGGYAVERRRDGRAAGYAEFLNEAERDKILERLWAINDERAELDYEWDGPEEEP